MPSQVTYLCYFNLHLHSPQEEHVMYWMRSFKWDFFGFGGKAWGSLTSIDREGGWGGPPTLWMKAKACKKPGNWTLSPFYSVVMGKSFLWEEKDHLPGWEIPGFPPPFPHETLFLQVHEIRQYIHLKDERWMSLSANEWIFPLKLHFEPLVLSLHWQAVGNNNWTNQ